MHKRYEFVQILEKFVRLMTMGMYDYDADMTENYGEKYGSNTTFLVPECFGENNHKRKDSKYDLIFGENDHIWVVKMRSCLKSFLL
ncbi:hypothetical protein CR513_31030, partial [Mucuna pruriens]